MCVKLSRLIPPTNSASIWGVGWRRNQKPWQGFKPLISAASVADASIGPTLPTRRKETKSVPQ